MTYSVGWFLFSTQNRHIQVCRFLQFGKDDPENESFPSTRGTISSAENLVKLLLHILNVEQETNQLKIYVNCHVPPFWLFGKPIEPIKTRHVSKCIWIRTEYLLMCFLHHCTECGIIGTGDPWGPCSKRSYTHCLLFVDNPPPPPVPGSTWTTCKIPSRSLPSNHVRCGCYLPAAKAGQIKSGNRKEETIHSAESLQMRVNLSTYIRLEHIGHY